MLKNIFCSLFIIAISLPKIVLAGPGDIRGMSTKDSGMALASQISNPSSFSAKGNPALLPWSQKSISIESYSEVFWLQDANVTSPNTTPLSGVAKDTRRASQTKPQNNFGLGLSLPLSPQFAIGIAGRFPSDSVAKIHAFTQNEANYLHYNDRQARPEIYTAAGFKFSQYFSMGAGLYYALKAKGTLQLGISQTDAESRLFLELLPEFIPYIGSAFKFDLFNKQTTLGINYRMEQKAQSRINVDLDFDVGIGTLPFSTSSELVAFYDPAILGIGITGEGKRIRPSFSYEWSRWSKYKEPVMSLTGKDLDTLNQGKSLATNIQLRDTHSIRIGAELPDIYEKLENKITLRTGIEFHTSAVDENTNNLTVVDSDKLGANIGVSWKRLALKPFIVSPLSFDAALKYMHLLETDFSDQNKTQHRRSKSGGEVAAILFGVTFDI